MIYYVHSKFKNFFRQRVSFIEAEKRAKQKPVENYEYKKLNSSNSAARQVYNNSFLP